MQVREAFTGAPEGKTPFPILQVQTSQAQKEYLPKATHGQYAAEPEFKR